jgi:hypothetical protein
MWRRCRGADQVKLVFGPVDQASHFAAGFGSGPQRAPGRAGEGTATLHQRSPQSTICSVMADSNLTIGRNG